MRLVFCFGLSLAIGWAAPAAAGILMPNGTEICGDVDVAGELTDPNTIFQGAEAPGLCEKLCRKTQKSCKVNSKANAACVLRVIRFSHRIASLHCAGDFDGQAERDCKENAEEFWLGGIDELKQLQRDELDACEEWGQTCSASCD